MAHVLDRPERTTLRRLEPGPLVRQARRAAGLSQIELARLVGTKQSVISRWERGVDEPRLSTLVRILDACELEVDLGFRRHDDVDRAQIQAQLARTPRDRLAASAAVARLVSRARRRG